MPGALKPMYWPKHIYLKGYSVTSVENPSSWMCLLVESTDWDRASYCEASRRPFFSSKPQRVDPAINRRVAGPGIPTPLPAAHLESFRGGSPAPEPLCAKRSGFQIPLNGCAAHGGSGDPPHENNSGTRNSRRLFRKRFRLLQKNSRH